MHDNLFPVDPAERKGFPLMSGCLDYFPAALAAVAAVSKMGNDQHNPGQPLHWARGKSMDHADALLRHLIDRGKVDSDQMPHSAKMAWRALALLQEELEAAGAPQARGAWTDEPEQFQYSLESECVDEGLVPGTISPADLRAYIESRVQPQPEALYQPDAPSPSGGSRPVRGAFAESPFNGARVPSESGRVLQFTPRPSGREPIHR